ncbi:hypothetical protein [Paraburkholderia rhizosphaerae]|uniref:Uncharacterized protein n=1 Tax=Paraburkholderia rhizosphaerae TaxID=480658 RepID=A0A4R8L5D2_9BURK|nr:hypothetical protein [Paraburkholderia rhizosphaerae]TDY37847.1 hypothetical protein BX592_13443 [Paraburkholderia rhizosphaerae]
MSRTYHYKGFSLEVAIESSFSWTEKIAHTRAPAYGYGHAGACRHALVEATVPGAYP